MDKTTFKKRSIDFTNLWKEQVSDEFSFCFFSLFYSNFKGVKNMGVCFCNFMFCYLKTDFYENRK